MTFSLLRPITETIADGLVSAAACMLSPRSFTSCRPSSKLHTCTQAPQDNSCQHHLQHKQHSDIISKMANHMERARALPQVTAAALVTDMHKPCICHAAGVRPDAKDALLISQKRSQLQLLSSSSALPHGPSKCECSVLAQAEPASHICSIQRFLHMFHSH